jgi:hypothetical protein
MECWARSWKEAIFADFENIVCEKQDKELL